MQCSLFCHQIVVEHHGCPGSLVVFCSSLSGAVESNNCVSGFVIMRCSLFLSGLYWNLDPVPLQWLSPSVSEELMVSPSPCEFPPLQLNYPFSPYCTLSQLFNISSPASLSSRLISASPLHFPHLAPPVLFLLPSPVSPLSQFSLASYLSTSIALLLS